MSIVGIGRKNFIFSNWAGIFSCKPSLYFQPSTQDEIISLIKDANDVGATISTVGSGHSPSDLTMTNDWLVNLDKYNGIENIERHESGLFADVTVQAGIRIYQLNQFLKENGLALQNLGSISEQSIAGIISTGTHGASPFHGLVSQQIVNMTIINGKGEEVYLDSLTNQDIFKAALLSLGKIGIISKVTVRAVPAFNIKSTQQVIDFDTLLEKWESIWVSSEFIRIWWYPYAKKCILWRGKKTDEPLSIPRKSWWGTTIGRFFYQSLLYLAVKIYPPFTPYVEKFVFNRQFGNVEHLDNFDNADSEQSDISVQHSVDALNMDCLFSQFVNEWAAPLNNGPEVLRSLEHSINNAASTHDFYVHVPIEVRCSNTTFTNDDIDLPNNLEGRSPLSSGPIKGNNLRPYLDNTPRLNHVPLNDVTNSQLTLYINATIYRPFQTDAPIEKWYKIFEKILGAAGGKPHWAKNFIGSTEYLKSNDSVHIKDESKYSDADMRGFATKVEEWFGDDLIEFRRIRREQDPNNIFVNNIDWCTRNGIVTFDEL